MTRSLRLLPRAEAELGEAIDWYEARRAGLGADLLELADKAFERILEAPHQLATHAFNSRRLHQCNKIEPPSVLSPMYPV